MTRPGRLGFKRAIILRPGVVFDGMEKPRAPLVENLMHGLGKIGQGLQDMVAQDEEVIGREAVKAALLVQKGKAPVGEYWMLGAADIARLGKTEWKELRGARKWEGLIGSPEGKTLVWIEEIGWVVDRERLEETLRAEREWKGGCQCG
jgi:hypothetical protein